MILTKSSVGVKYPSVDFKKPSVGINDPDKPLFDLHKTLFVLINLDLDLFRSREYPSNHSTAVTLTCEVSAGARHPAIYHRPAAGDLAAGHGGEAAASFVGGGNMAGLGAGDMSGTSSVSQSESTAPSPGR